MTKYPRQSPENLSVSPRARHREAGSALIYILIAVALLAALTVSLMEPGSQQAQSQNTGNIVTLVNNQVDFINSAIQECVLSHPDQASDLTATEQKNAPYPINPKDPYFNSATPDTADNDYVSEIRCAGNPGGSGSNQRNHALLFGGTSGKFMPPKPNLLTEWSYYNGADGVFLLISSPKKDAYIKSAFDRLDKMYSPCEADVYDQRSAGAVTLSNDTVPGDSGPKSCAAGSICFRFWIVRKPTAIPSVTACNS